MATATSIVGLAEELGIERKLFCCWQDAYENGGSVALRRAGRPSRASTLDVVEAPVLAAEAETARAKRQIEELRRKIGQQQLDLDFFRAALRQVREQRRTKGGPGETVSTR
jgi:hypothetical protein